MGIVNAKNWLLRKPEHFLIMVTVIGGLTAGVVWFFYMMNAAKIEMAAGNPGYSGLAAILWFPIIASGVAAIILYPGMIICGGARWIREGRFYLKDIDNF